MNKLGLSFVCYLSLGCMFLGSLNDLSAVLLNFADSGTEGQAVVCEAPLGPKVEYDLLNRLFNLYAGNPSRIWLHAVVASVLASRFHKKSGLFATVYGTFPAALIADIIFGVYKSRKDSFEALDFGNPARLGMYSAVAGEVLFRLKRKQRLTPMDSPYINFGLGLYITIYVGLILTACTVYDLVLCVKQLRQKECGDDTLELLQKGADEVEA